MKILVLASIALAVVLTLNMVTFDSGAPTNAAASPTPARVADAFVVPTPIVPAEAIGSAEFGYGQARATDW